LIYNIFIQLFGLAIRIHALFNSKSKDWVDGRRNWKSGLSGLSHLKNQRVAWFHVASLGEFEQSLPIMEKLKAEFKIVVTIFSPSGYEHRKDHTLPDHVLYLPLDTTANAKAMVAAINPAVLVVNKYDLWFNHLNEAKKAGAKLVLVTANFRENHHYFKWYGFFGRKMLGLFDQILVQNEDSKELLNSIGMESKLSGDTRYDRVMNHAKTAQIPEAIASFVGQSKVVVFGSSWPESEKMLAAFLDQLPEDTKVIIAPHDISKARVQSIATLFPKAILHSQLNENASAQILIIDNIGLLSSLYKVASVAYIGGAFGSGLHNILEAMAFGVPVVFGPNTAKFPEAKDALKSEVATQISNGNELRLALTHWVETDLNSTRKRVLRYMNSRVGATEISVKAIHDSLGITQQ
jgi:3-deoxy-D-manno-octulosonic-acid transferase